MRIAGPAFAEPGKGVASMVQFDLVVDVGPFQLHSLFGLSALRQLVFPLAALKQFPASIDLVPRGGNQVYPEEVANVSNVNEATLYPSTYLADWCGEFVRTAEGCNV